MNAEWFSASELAASNLPELPRSKKGIIERAQKYRWKCKPRESGRGGGLVYHVSSLPKSARETLQNAVIDKAIGAPTADRAITVHETKADTADLTAWQREVMQARIAILNWIDAQAREFGLDRIIRRIVDLSKSGNLPPNLEAVVPVANAKSGRQSGRTKTTLSRATVYNWIRWRREGGVTGLAPRLSSEADLDIPEWAPALLDLYRRPSKPSLLATIETLPSALPEGVPVPSYDQARRFIGKLSEVTKNKGRMGPQALKSLKAFTRRDVSELWPGAVYTADGHTFKATVQHPFHGSPFRPEITIVLDVATRYAVGWSIGLAENSLGVLEALSHAMVPKDDGRKAAVPAIWYTDNGGGFKNEMLGGPAVGFYDRWGITAKHSLPYNSQARGIVERFQRYWVNAAKSLPSYQGRDMDKEATRQRKRIVDADLKANKASRFDLTWDEFKAFIQAKIDEYNARPHSGLKRVRDAGTNRLRHLSPIEAWEEWEARGNQPIVIEREDAADLWRPYERRKVARCEVQVLGNTYFSLDLEPYHGDEVQVGYDIHDGSRVWVRDFDGRLLAVAEVDGNSRPYFDDGTLAEAVSFQQRRHEQRIKGRLKRVDSKREEILAEAPDTTLTIEHEETITVDAIDKEAADREFARLEGMSEPFVEPVESNARPVFADDLSWARWVAMNPHLATEDDKARMRTALRRPGFAQLLNFAGVEVTTLTKLAA